MIGRQEAGSLRRRSPIGSGTASRSRRAGCRAGTRGDGGGQGHRLGEAGGGGPTRVLFRGGEHGADVCVFVVDFAPGKGPRLHRHPYEEVFLVHEGVARFTAGEETLEARVGQVVVAPAAAPHRFVNLGEGRIVLVSIHPCPHVEQEDLRG